MGKYDNVAKDKEIGDEHHYHLHSVCGKLKIVPPGGSVETAVPAEKYEDFKHGTVVVHPKNGRGVVELPESMTKMCEFCLSEVPSKARRCKFCTSDLEGSKS